MAKLDFSFEQFSEIVTTKGYTPFLQGKSVYFIRSPKNAKVEVNVHSTTYAIGAGLKPEITDKIVEAAKEKGFTLMKRPAGWAVLNYIDMDRFFDLIEIVDSNIPEKSNRGRPAKAKDEVIVNPGEVVKVAPATSTKTPEEIAAIKEANLAKMKEVAAKLKKEKKEKKAKEEPKVDSDPTPTSDSFVAPETLSVEEVQAMV